MFGVRLSTVFQSRWKAALWAFGILLTAYCSVPSPDAPPEASPPPVKHVSPWTKGD